MDPVKGIRDTEMYIICYSVDQAVPQNHVSICESWLRRVNEVWSNNVMGMILLYMCFV